MTSLHEYQVTTVVTRDGRDGTSPPCHSPLSTRKRRKLRDGKKAAVENAGQESTDRKVAGRLDRQTHAHRNDRFLQPDNTMISRKSLFTENSVATQKQYSTSINTNKIQSTTIKSITSSFFTKLNYLLHLITKLAKATCCGNVSYY